MNSSYFPCRDLERLTSCFKNCKLTHISFLIARISTKGSGGSGSRPNSRRVRSNTRRNKKEDKSKRQDNNSRQDSQRSAKQEVKRSRSRQGK
jgi:hypothetical protein